ncbi:magnesium transporter CorA family protein [bacterium]|nr:magnesium transporter CorA family protein [bacterium]
MKTYMDIRDQRLTQVEAGQGNIIVYASPDANERKELDELYDVDAHMVDSSLDADEIARVEFSNAHLFIVWKKPKTFTFTGQLSFGMASIGVLLRADKLVFITDEPASLFEGKQLQKLSSLHDVVLRVLLQTVHHFVGHLKGVKQISADIQKKLNYSQENVYLLQMFSLSETLIYYLDAIESNSAVLSKLKSASETRKITLSQDGIELLDDIIIDNQQCSKQAEIYSSVLSGMMDARGSIVNNNMNVLLKNLTLINVVFMPLNLLASVGGMSEYSMMTQGLDWRIAYFLFMLAMAGLGWATWVFLHRQISGQQRIERTQHPPASTH